MNRTTLRNLAIAASLLAFLCLPSIASADGVTWDLVGVTFDDGGTASGSFVYDAVSNTVSDVNITTSAGTAFGGDTYTGEDPSFGSFADEFVVVTDPTLVDFTNTPVLILLLADSLTRAAR
jgi:hypothetical protein